jgi:hypothetical protein
MVTGERRGNAKPRSAAARSKRAVKPKAGTAAKPAEAVGQAQAVQSMLTKIEKKMSGDQMKATLGDYIRLVQLRKELGDEPLKEIKVTWVEPARDKAEETVSGNEE